MHQPSRPFVLDAMLDSGPQADHGTALGSRLAERGDAPGGRQTEYHLSVGDVFEGAVHAPGDHDWIAITLQAGQMVDIELHGIGLRDAYLRLMDSRGRVLDEDDDGGAAFDSHIVFTPTRTGTYYVDAAAYGDLGSGTYEVSVTAAAAGPDILWPDFDPLDVISWGAALPRGQVRVHFAPAGYGEGAYRAEGFRGYEVARFRAAFDLIEQVTDLTFVETDRPEDADLRLLLDTDELRETDLLGLFFAPGDADAGLGVFNGAAWDRWPGGDLEAGGLGFQTIVHELLHGLGLAHPHDTSGGSSAIPGVTEEFDDTGAYGLNQGVYTTMSYIRGLHGDAAMPVDGRFGVQVGPMALDIALLQQLYGTDTETRPFATDYALPDRNGVGTGWQSIWDAGGRDSIVYDGRRDAVIDLRAATLEDAPGGGGYLSSAAGIAGGFTIAAGVLIENARSGAGADRLIGNDADNLLAGRSGGDVLRGGDGDDALHGGYGDDRLIGGSGADLLLGGRGGDLLRGGDGDDRVIGGRGRDIAHMGAGDDVFEDTGQWGRFGQDVVHGNGGDDRILGRAGRDLFDGGFGADTLRGGGGDDRLDGGAGADLLIGGRGSDTLSGGGFADRFRFADGIGNDVIADFDPLHDKLLLGAGLWDAAEDPGAVLAQHARGTAEGVVLGFDAGGSLLLDGVDLADLSADSLILF